MTNNALRGIMAPDRERYLVRWKGSKEYISSLLLRKTEIDGNNINQRIYL